MGIDPNIERDKLERGSDLSDVEIAAAEKHLRDRLRHNGKLTGCTSYVQRRMGIGYNHAARILDYLVACHFITEPDSNGERHPWHEWDRGVGS
jgi:DNA segregation ATPase FtsK/SpoIIIE-like protein